MKGKDKSCADNILHIYHELLNSKKHQPSPRVPRLLQRGPCAGFGRRRGLLCRCWGAPTVLVCTVLLRPGAAAREHGCACRGGRTGRAPRPSASSSPAEPWLPLGALQQRSRSHLPAPRQGWQPCTNGVEVLETWRAPELLISFSFSSKLPLLPVDKCLMNITAWKASRPEMRRQACSSSHMCETETARCSPAAERGLQRLSCRRTRAAGAVPGTGAARRCRGAGDTAAPARGQRPTPAAPL